MNSISWAGIRTKNSFVLSSIFILLSLHVLCEETSHIEGRVKPFKDDSHTVWIGVFSSPLSDASQASSWTAVETESFRLHVPDIDEVILFALQKDSVPLVKRISSTHFSKDVVLDFRPGRKLRGTVLSEDEFPIPESELSISCNDLPKLRVPEEARPKWNSDFEGKFEISGLLKGECEIDVVARPEMPMESFDVQIKSNDTVRDFILADVNFVSGRIVGHGGDVVSNAEVTADVPFGEWFSTSSDKDGRFSFGPFLKGTSISLFAKHSTNGSTRNFEVLAGKHDLLIRLSPLARVVGMVVDSKTGDPLDDFVLHARRQHAGVKFPHKETEGRISAMVDSNSHSVAVEAPGYVSHWEDATFVVGIVHDLGTVELEPGKTLTGRTYDVSNGNPVPDVQLFQVIDYGDTVFGTEGLQVRYFAETVAATSDNQGAFSIGPLSFEDVKLLVGARDYEGRTIVVTGEVETLDVSLNPTQPSRTRIRGIVQSTLGEPISGRVEFNSDTGYELGLRSNEDGTFDKGVFPGSFEVYASTEFGKSHTENISLEEGETVNLTLTVDSRGSLAGVIKGLQAGEEVSLRITDPWDQPVRYGYRWGNGDFLIEGLSPGKYLVYATSHTNREIVKSFELRGEDGEAFVELIFLGKSRLYGSVAGSSYESHEIRVLATPSGDAETKGWSEVYDDGTYDIQGLENGTYSVAAYRRSYSRSIELRGKLGPSHEVFIQGDTQLDISLSGSQKNISQSRSYVVSGTIHPIDKTRDAIVSLSSHTVSKSQQLSAENQGEFRFTGLPSGHYVLLVVADGHVDYSETLNVASSISGHQITLEPEPQGSLQISGTVSPSIRAEGVSISVIRQSDGARVKSVQVMEGGKFTIEQLPPDKYELVVYIKGLGNLQKKVSLDASVEGLEISFEPTEQ